MQCFKCGAKQELEYNKVSFRAVCHNCGNDLHVCKNCRHYAPGKPNDCNVPGTPPIKDREASNLCEDFSPKPDASPPQKNTPKKSLWDDEEPPRKKGKDAFEDLF